MVFAECASPDLVRRKPHLRFAAELVPSVGNLEWNLEQSSPPVSVKPPTGRSGSATAEHKSGLMLAQTTQPFA